MYEAKDEHVTLVRDAPNRGNKLPVAGFNIHFEHAHKLRAAVVLLYILELSLVYDLALAEDELEGNPYA